MNIQQIKTQLEEIYKDLNKQERGLENIARSMSITINEVQDHQGNFMFTPILVAKAQILVALKELNAYEYEETVPLRNPPLGRFDRLGGKEGQMLCSDCHGEITATFCERCGNTGLVDKEPTKQSKDANQYRFIKLGGKPDEIICPQCQGWAQEPECDRCNGRGLVKDFNS